MNFQPIIDFIRELYPGRDFIPLHEPCFSGNEKRYLADCIDTTFVSSVGKYVDRFEEHIREYTGAKYAVATVNGTAALHIALLLAGVQPGDLVITQPLTFIATCNAISYCNAEPSFIDVDKRTLGLSSASLSSWLENNAELVNNDTSISDKSMYGNKPGLAKPDHIAIHKATGRRIGACVPMHTFGHPCEIDKIVAICERFYIPVVEDAAESLGSLFNGTHTGRFGKLGTLSFNGNKTITTGGGGMIITDDPELGKLAKYITTTAKKPHPWRFDHDMIGYNYRLPNINAALGCAQMELLPDLLTSKRSIASGYQAFFSGEEGIEYVPEPGNSRSNYWLNAILLSDPVEHEEFLKFSNDNKVMTRPAWTLMNELPMFKGSISGETQVSKDIAERLVNLPSSPILTR